MATTKTKQRRPSGTKSATKPKTRFDRLTEATREARRTSIDAYETTWIRVADAEDTLAARAEGTPARWIAPVLAAQAAFTRDTAQTVARYSRKVAL
jgi:hypothetical protein